MFLGSVQYFLVAVVGGWRVVTGAITIGDVQAFIQYSRSFSMPLTQLASMMNVFQSGIASLERVFEFLDADEQSAEAPVTENPPPVQGRVEFRDVTFSYNPKTPLIESLSLVAEPGQTIAIVGPTGAGKTTLVNLIMRFYELNGGAIELDGRDISSMPRSELRSKIGMVLQDTWLFGGTIRDNIAYGNPSATTRRSSRRPGQPMSIGSCTRYPRGTTASSMKRATTSVPARSSSSQSPRLPCRPVHPHSRRGHELGRHAY